MLVNVVKLVSWFLWFNVRNFNPPTHSGVGSVKYISIKMFTQSTHRIFHRHENFMAVRKTVNLAIFDPVKTENRRKPLHIVNLLEHS